jgi:solute:Na+ symporter, SSS family
VPIYFSTMARKLDLEIVPGSSVLMTAVSHLTNPVITAFFSCAILMAIISTADSLICAISSNLACDFPKLRSQKIAWAQGLTFIIGMISLVASYYFKDIISIMIMSYELSVSVLFIPVVMGVLSPQKNSKAAAAAMILGAMGFVIFRLWEPPIPREIASLIMSFLGYRFFCNKKIIS